MSITEDLKNVSEAALGKLAAQFGDLPRPLLAAIGAGDVAVERLARLRDQLGELWNEERTDAADQKSGESAEGEGEDGTSRLADATRRAQQIVEDVAHKLGDVMGEVPDKAQKLIADLPAKAQEVANALSRENLKETVESYTKRVADVYRELADRGGARVHDAEEAGAAKEPASAAGTPGDTNAPDDGAPGGRETDATPAGQARGKASPESGAATQAPSARKPASTKPAAPKPAGPKPAGAKPAGATPGAPTPAAAPDARKPASTKPAGAKPGARRPAAPKPTTDGVDD